MSEAATFGARVRRLPVAARVALVVLLALVVFEIVDQALDQSFGGNPSGAASSSYATTSRGLAGYASLLTRYGHPVERQRGDLATAKLDPGATLMILDPDVLTGNDAGAALQFVVNGGRLVIGGPNGDRYLHLLRDHPPTWAASDTTTFTGTVPPFDTIGRVVTEGAGTWRRAGSSEVAVGRSGDALLTHERVGRGEMWFISDVTPLSNTNLDRAGNAAFGLLLAGPNGQRVTFAEGVHGYAEKRGFAAVPGRWKIMFAGIALAVIVFAWARGHRLGPPEDRERPLPPARREYVDALAATLARTRDPERASASALAAARANINARVSIDAGANGTDLERATRAAGFDDEEVRVVVHGVATDDDVVTIGRVLARTAEWTNGRRA